MKFTTLALILVRTYGTGSTKMSEFIYNAARNAGAPRLTIQTEVLRNGQVVLTGRARMVVEAGSDPDRIPFGDQLALASLPAGKYDLQVIVKDEIAGTTIIQQTDFEHHGI